jgi:hypothetical protein
MGASVIRRSVQAGLPDGSSPYTRRPSSEAATNQQRPYLPIGVLDAVSEMVQSSSVPLLTIELRNSRDEVLERVFDEGSLGRIRPPLDDVSSPCLRFVDPYGNTVLNPLQAAALGVELKAIVCDIADVDDRDRVMRVVDLADRCADGVHVYLWFIGD